eukprot:scaffold60730_cov75-Phaeocystis_antarctica.AAC.6
MAQEGGPEPATLASKGASGALDLRRCGAASPAASHSAAAASACSLAAARAWTGVALPPSPAACSAQCAPSAACGDEASSGRACRSTASPSLIALAQSPAAQLTWKARCSSAATAATVSLTLASSTSASSASALQRAQLHAKCRCGWRCAAGRASTASGR